MIFAFLAWIMGIIVQLQQAKLWLAWCYVVIFLISLLSICSVVYVGFRAHQRERKSPDLVLGFISSYSVQGIMIFCMALAGFSWAGVQASYKMSQALDPLYEQQNIWVTGTIAGLPEQQSGRWRFHFDVQKAWLDTGESEAQATRIKLPPRLLLSWYLSSRETEAQTVPKLKTGQQWSFQVRIKAPHGSVNLHTYDYELWLWSQGVGAVGYVRTAKDSPQPLLLNHNTSHIDMSRWRELVRERIMETVADARQAGFIAALTLGDQRAIASSDWDTFRITGVTHLVSISGLHITMMAWIMYGIVGWLWRRCSYLMFKVPAHIAAMVVGLLCAALYAWFTGWGIPAQRTVMMLATVVLLRCLGIRWPWYAVWLLIAVVIATIDPWALLQAGFWLSFVAVGVLFAQSSQPVDALKNQTIEEELQQLELLMPRPWWQRMLGYVGTSLRELLRVQMRISIALAPLTLLLFQQVSVIGLVANMLAIPWVTFVIVPLSILGLVFHPIWHVAAWAGHVLLVVLDGFASLPLAVFNGASPPLLLALIAMTGAVAVVLPQLRWRWRCLSVLLIIPIFVWQPPKPKLGEFEAIFLDVGQGSAVLIRTQNHALLYDTGARYSDESNAGAVLVVPALRALGVSLNRIVVSHADSDHAGGLASVWASHPQADLLYNVSDEIFDQDEKFQHVSKNRQDCMAGLSWVWDGVTFEMLSPDIESEQTQQDMTSNAQSCVLRISTLGEQPRAVLLTGDIDQKQEVLLLQQAHTRDKAMRADILLMPHHGSKSSSSDAFLSAVAPTWAIAQTGYLNRYQHPAVETLERYHAQGIKTINTVTCGAAIWQSDSPEQMSCARKMRERYWQHSIL